MSGVSINERRDNISELGLVIIISREEGGRRGSIPEEEKTDGLMTERKRRRMARLRRLVQSIFR